MSKNLFSSIFIGVFISIFLVACGGGPSTVPDSDGTTSDKEKLKDPRSIRLEYAQQLLERAQDQKQPLKNQSYLEIVQLLFKNQPGGAEYRLIEEVLGLIDKNILSPMQYSQYIVDYGRLYFEQEDFYQAQQFLEQEINTDDPNILLRYHQLRAQLFELNQQNIEAIQEFIKLHSYLTGTDAAAGNLESIWEVLSRFSLQQLEQNIADYNFGNQNELLGWQQLAFLVKSTPNRFLLNKKLRNWQVNFPNHMASYQFIQEQLKKRFELLLQPRQIAVLMPTTGKLSKPAKTIRRGILAAHFQQPLDNELIIRFYDTANTDSIWSMYKQAVYEGAEAVIGPLTKKHLTELAETDTLPVPTLALNQVTNGQRTTNLYQFGLLPEDEATQVAKSARQDGHLNAAIMAPDTNWGKRLKKSFQAEWEKQGGRVVESQLYQTQTHDFSDPIKKLLNLDESVQRKQNLRQIIGKKFEFTPRIRQDVDMIFVAAFPKQARQIPLQISYYHGENIPIYATSHIISKKSDYKANKDLNGINYTDMPWMLNANLEAISRESLNSRASYQRLFALGVDTYLVLPYLQFLEKNNVEFYHGETGILSVLNNGKINRMTPMGTIKNGQSRLIKSAKDILASPTEL